MSIQTVNDARIIIKNDSSANWKNENPILLKGEIGIEIDTSLFKFGNGIDGWNDLEYASSKPTVLIDGAPDKNDWEYPVGTVVVDSTAKAIYILADNTENNAVYKKLVDTDDIASFCGGDMLKSDFATNDKISQGYVDRAISADVLTVSRKISLTGDVEAIGASFDGGSDITLTTSLSDILTGGSGFYKITVNNKGQVTAISEVTAADIPSLTLSKITDAGTAASRNVGVKAGNAVVVESDGLINSSLIGSLHVVDVDEFGTIDEMLSWSVAEQGDVAIVNLESGVEVYILKNGSASVLSNWVRLNIPTGAVVSVNGGTGAVTLTTTNIPEGTNHYYTDTRATSNFNTNFALQSSSGLVDGSTILHSADTLILNGGNATLV